MFRASLLLAAAVVTLSACGTMNRNVSGDWSCAAPVEGTCSTIREADRKAANKAGRTAAVSPAAAPARATRRAVYHEAGQAPEATAPPANLVAPSPEVTTAALSPLRSPEELARIYFFSWVDKSGNLHEGGYVHVVLRPSDWVLQ